MPVLPFHTYCRPADLWMDLRPTLNCFSTLLRCLPVLPCQIRDRDELSGQHRCVVSRHCLTIPVAVLSSFERIRDLDELACQHLPVLWCFPVLPCCTGCRPAALWMATRPTSTCFSALLRCLTVLPCRTCYRPADLWMDLRPTPTCFSALLYCLPVLYCLVDLRKDLRPISMYCFGVPVSVLWNFGWVRDRHRPASQHCFGGCLYCLAVPTTVLPMA